VDQSVVNQVFVVLDLATGVVSADHVLVGIHGGRSACDTLNTPLTGYTMSMKCMTVSDRLTRKGGSDPTDRRAKLWWRVPWPLSSRHSPPIHYSEDRMST
jgi:hypothetical protein